MTAPALPDVCWPVDLGCCEKWDEYPPEVQDRSISLATTTLRAMSGFRVGGCPITVRPCRKDCSQPWLLSGYSGEPGLGYPSGPVNLSGRWVNAVCGCGVQDCSCSTVCEVVLPGPVGFVESVQIGTEVLPESWYRVDGGNRLVWTGPDVADCWPLCQDMSGALGDENTFFVTYLNALPVDGLASYAAGVLACEFAKACTGAKCRLPAGVSAVVRQGVAFTITSNAFDGARTGILEVDAWLRSVNPNSLVQPSRVWSPDITKPRVTTWSSP